MGTCGFWSQDLGNSWDQDKTTLLLLCVVTKYKDSRHGHLCSGFASPSSRDPTTGTFWRFLAFLRDVRNLDASCDWRVSFVDCEIYMCLSSPLPRQRWATNLPGVLSKSVVSEMGDDRKLKRDYCVSA